MIAIWRFVLPGNLIQLILANTPLGYNNILGGGRSRGAGSSCPVPRRWKSSASVISVIVRLFLLSPSFPRAFQCKARGASEGRFPRAQGCFCIRGCFACRCHAPEHVSPMRGVLLSGVLPRRWESMRQYTPGLGWPFCAFVVYL